MDLPVNTFKAKLREGQSQIGLWCGLPGSYTAEIVAPAGFDWLLFDTEHSPSDVLSVLPQLQAVAAYDVAPVVRPAANDPVLIKRFLDIGVQTLLIPYVQNAAEAKAAVDATRYPPEGIRGVSALTRATRFGRVKSYAQLAAQEICVLVQVETREAMAHIEAIASIDGVDGIFIGPADLAASFGHPGQPGHVHELRVLIEEFGNAIRIAAVPRVDERSRNVVRTIERYLIHVIPCRSSITRRCTCGTGI